MARSSCGGSTPSHAFATRDLSRARPTWRDARAVRGRRQLTVKAVFMPAATWIVQ